MNSIKVKHIGKNDIMDRILTYSKIKENKSGFLKFDFQLASLSIQKTLKIYSDKIKIFSVSTTDFLRILINKKLKIRKNDTSSKKTPGIEELKILFYFSSIKKKQIFLFLNHKFNFFRKKEIYLSILEKKKLKSPFVLLKLYLKLIFFFGSSNCLIFSFNHEKKFRFLDFKKPQIFNSMRIKKQGIIISKKILKNKVIKLVENFYKTKQVWEIDKIFKTFYKIKCRYIFPYCKNIRNFRNISIDRLDNFYLVSKVNDKNIFVNKKKKYSSKTLCILIKINPVKNFRMKINIKRIFEPIFFYTFRISSIFTNEWFGNPNTAIFVKKKKILNNPINFLKIEFEKNFIFFWKKKKGFSEKNFLFLNFTAYQKESEKYFCCFLLKKGEFKPNSYIKENFFFRKKKICIFIFSNFFRINKRKIKTKMFLNSIRKKFELLKHLIFSQIKNNYKILLNARMNKIYFLSHKKKIHTTL